MSNRVYKVSMKTYICCEEFQMISRIMLYTYVTYTKRNEFLCVQKCVVSVFASAFQYKNLTIAHNPQSNQLPVQGFVNNERRYGVVKRSYLKYCPIQTIINSYYMSCTLCSPVRIKPTGTYRFSRIPARLNVFCVCV